MMYRVGARQSTAQRKADHILSDLEEAYDLGTNATIHSSKEGRGYSPSFELAPTVYQK